MAVKGYVTQVLGPVVVLSFEGPSPEIGDFVQIFADDDNKTAIGAEVMQDMGDGNVRGLTIGASEGLARGLLAESKGGGITVPVGEGCLGRLFNVLGEPLDD